MKTSRGKKESITNPHVTEDGYVSSRLNPFTGAWNVLYRVDREDGRWTVMCSAHGACVSVRTKKPASKMLLRPTDWCNACAETRELKEAQTVLDGPTRADTEQLKMWANLAKGDSKKCALFEELHGVKPDQFWD